MNTKHGVALALVAILAFSAMIPVSHASTIKVVLNPNSDEATVSSYINSSLVISANSSSQIGQAILKDVLSSSSSGDLKINTTYLNNDSLAFQILNHSISERDKNAQLNNLSMSYSRTIESYNTSGEAKLYANSSLRLNMVLTGIFYNNSANLTWRSFSTNQSLSLGDTNVNQANFSNGSFTSSKSVNTVNMSAFSKSLVQWNRTYDPTSNTTTFFMNAGTTVDFHDNGSIFGTNFSLTFTLDPAYSISAPGYDSASADSITLGNPPASNPILYYAIGAILVVGAIITMYIRRRGAR